MDPSFVVSQEDERNTTGDATSICKEVVGSKRRWSAKVWEHYEVMPSTKIGETDKAKCKYCEKVYSVTSRNGTTTVIRHIEKNHKDVSNSSSITSEGMIGSSKTMFNQAVYREFIAKAIIRHGYAFSWVEHEGIRDIHIYLNGNVKTVCRNTAKSDCLEMHMKLKEKCKLSLQRIPSRICLTCDLWSACTTEGYLCLTAHYIDEEWRLNSKVLNFCHVPPPHTGLLLYEKIFRLLKDWGIEDKIFSITLDNASNNDTMQDLLCNKLNSRHALPCHGRFFHIRCAAHILNLIVKEGLKVIDECVKKVRESVKFVNGSEARKIKFKECVEDARIECKASLWMDVPTRWNSTYKMLEKALIYRSAFSGLAICDGSYQNLPTHEEWSRIEKIYRLLQPFNEITNLFSGSNYPTANLYFANVWTIQMRLQREMESSDPVIKEMAKNMKEKFDKYWSEYSTILSLAVVLDPRHKLQFLTFCYKKLYGDTYLAKFKVEEVYNALKNLYNDYSKMNDIGLSQFTASPSAYQGCEEDVDASAQFEVIPSYIEIADFDEFNDVENGMRKSALDLDLDEDRIDRKVKLDILSYWKVNVDRYKELSLLAMDVLSIPITTVASESTFSIGGRILNKWRSSLLPENVEALITTRNWLFAYEDYEDVDNEIKELGKNVDFVTSSSSPSTEPPPAPPTSSIGSSRASNAIDLNA